MNLVLASTSERRKEILKLLGLPFEVVAPLYEEETLDELSPYEEALRFSKEKAKSVAHGFPDSLIIGSDTLIEFQGRKIGKPKDPEDAKEILRSLRNGSHDILSGIALYDTRQKIFETRVELIRVQMRKYSDEEIDHYVATGEGLDKAGAYALQGRGRELIENLEGDYLAAVGLPLKPIARFLEGKGVKPPIDVEKIYREKNFLNWKTYA
ncbi:MAG: Maf family protein [bacterium]